MNETLARQLAIDFCTDVHSVMSKENVFTEYQPLPGRRIFREGECFLKAASVNGKILASGKKEIIQWLQAQYPSAGGAWFMDMPSLHELQAGLTRFGCRIAQAHPFYIAMQMSPVESKGLDIRLFTGDALEQFRGDERLSQAFLFSDLPRDEIGIGAYRHGKLLGMAGASSDSELMWQIGINVMPQAEGQGIGTMLVTLLKNEILERGKLPFYGTAISHIASQRVALGAGFFPAWAELYCEAVQ